MRFFLLVCFLVLALNSAKAQYIIPANVHRIVFLGNSITYSGQYVTDVEAYLIAKYPNRKFEIVNLGLPSETVSGLSEEGHAGGQFPRPDLHERLTRVLEMTKPDLVFASYGMNDGIYMPFDSTRFQKYKDGQSWLHEKVVNSGAKIVHLTPPIFDEKRWQVKGYSLVLDKYSNWILQQRKTQKWNVADVHFPMQKSLDEYRKIDSTFYFAKDGVHPGDLGHWVMAQQILLFLGEREALATKNINEAMSAFPNGEEILKFTTQRQAITKDAWLTAIGHKRPGMAVGLPLDSVLIQAGKIELQIRGIVK